MDLLCLLVKFVLFLQQCLEAKTICHKSEKVKSKNMYNHLLSFEMEID